MELFSIRIQRTFQLVSTVFINLPKRKVQWFYVLSLFLLTFHFAFSGQPADGSQDFGFSNLAAQHNRRAL